MLEFSDQHAWFELSAFLAQDSSWVVVIITRRCGAALDDTVCFRRSDSLDDIEDFVFNFDPAADLPHSDAAHYYYECAAERLVTQLPEFVDFHRAARLRPTASMWDRLLNLIARVIW